MTRSIFWLCWATAAATAGAQIGVEVSLERQEYLLYETIPLQVRLVSFTSEPLDLAKLSEEGLWLDLRVLLKDGTEVERTDRGWKPPRMVLEPGQARTLRVDLVPYFFIRETGEYRAAAAVNLKGRRFTGRAAQFTVVRGGTIWEQVFDAPPDASSAAKDTRLRHYSLIVHAVPEGQILYARIQAPEAAKIYCTTPLGPTLNYGEPAARVDLKGDLHVLHQSGTRLFTYTRFSANGRRLAARYFSNISSPPKLVKLGNDEMEVVGGEEIFVGKDKKETMIPTAPAGKPPTP